MIAGLQRLKASVPLPANGPGQNAVLLAEAALARLVEDSDESWSVVKAAVGPSEVDSLHRLKRS
jgi:hypothetical protein